MSICFKVLIGILFLLPFLKFLVRNKNSKYNTSRSYWYLFLVFFTLYFFIWAKIFELYELNYFEKILLFLAPVISSIILFRQDQALPQNKSLIHELSYYILPLFMCLNFLFDFSKPDTKECLIIEREVNVMNTFNIELPEITLYKLEVVPIKQTIIKKTIYREKFENYKFQTQNRNSEILHVSSKTYDRFKNKEKIKLEEYKGFFGIKWYYYR